MGSDCRRASAKLFDPEMVREYHGIFTAIASRLIVTISE
jgi:hypothetical protein